MRLRHAWALGLALLIWAGAATGATSVPEIALDGPVGPATADFVLDGLSRAEADHAPAVILRLDTPGGLSSSMRRINKAILASPVPVIGYVAPGGARAASAGTYILYATHIAAMAPATHLGAATPINIGGDGGGGDRTTPADADKNEKPGASDRSGDDQSKTATDKTSPEATPADLSSGATERRKQVNDAVAYIRSLAERRGRNADWAERAVRQAATLTATQARDAHVIDVIAPDESALLAAIDGRQVETQAGARTLATRGLSVTHITPGWQTELLAFITNPTVAYLLFMIGLVGLAAEAFNPGATLPGVVGGISLISALYAFAMLPVDLSGAALVLLGVALFVAEAFVPSFGALGFGGLVALVVGSIMLMDAPGTPVSIALIVLIALAAAALLGLLVWLFGRARATRIETGHEGLLGRTCTARFDFSHQGRVWLHGESWLAETPVPVVADQLLTVVRVDGLTVHVRPAEAADTAPDSAAKE